MRLHTLKTTPGSRKGKVRVGRGRASGCGKTCGRGHKGQMSRKGSTHKPGFEGGQMRLIRRLPKRGFKNPTRKEYVAVNVGLLSRFDDGAVVTADLMRTSGVARGNGAIKILGQGDLAKKITVQAQAFSATAQTKIESAGGACEVVKS